MRIKSSWLCVITAVTAVSAFGQGTVDQRAYQPTEEEIAANKRRAELLRHPTFITLRLSSSPRDAPRDPASDTPAPYKVKDRMRFQLFITQNSFETLRLYNFINPYYEYRPELLRDGETVSYSEKAQERVKRAEHEPHSGSMYSVELMARQEKQWGYVDLEDWYEPPFPGRYQLTVRKQFARGGDWVVSNPVYFEVIARPPASPIPAGVTIELAPDLSQTNKNEIYQAADDVIVVITVLNNSDQPLKLNVIDREYGNRPQLFRDGKLVSYREEVAQRIAAKEDNPRLVEIINDLFLDPKSRSWSQGISLKDWYGPLAPGKYRLTNRHRFEIDGPWTAESAPLVFEVALPKAN